MLSAWKSLKRHSKLGPEEEKERGEEIEKLNPSWKDKFAMIFSAYIVLFLPAALIIVVLALFCLWLFKAL